MKQKYLTNNESYRKTKERSRSDVTPMCNFDNNKTTITVACFDIDGVFLVKENNNQDFFW